MNNVLITICARGGSRGVPNKNIKPINGVPLIGYTIKTAFEISKTIGADISLSTDSKKIKDIASEFSLKTNYTRPASLSTSSAGKIPTIKDLLDDEEKKRNKKYNYIIDLDVSSPLRTLDDVQNAFNKLINSEAYNIFSVNRANKNPYFNMVEEKNGYCHLSKSSINILSRQKAPEVFDMNASFYIYKRSFFENKFETAITDKSLIYLMNHLCFDIDNPLDFLILDFLISNNHLDINL